MPRSTRKEAVGTLDDLIDTGVEGFLAVAAVAREAPADARVQETLAETMEDLDRLVRLRNGLDEAG